MIGTDRRLAAWISVIGLAAAASVTSVTNGFTFDDIHIIFLNDRVHSLARWWELFAGSYWPPEKGGDLYRPLTMLGFATQWVLGGGSPLIFHLGSILLYALVCGVFLWVAVSLLPLGPAWLAASLFAVHPLHVEAVGNVVGQSELWAALFMFFALGMYLRARQRGTLSLAQTWAIAVLYALACLSKEHAIVLPLLLLAAELTVTPRAQPVGARMAAIRPLVLLLAAVGIAFVWVRIAVLARISSPGPQVSIIFVEQSVGIRAMTMLRVLLEWVRLFFWPAHLSADYAPRHIDIVTGPTFEMLPSAAILIGVAWLAWLARRATPVVTFAVLWVAVGLLIPSNIVVPTGFVLAERTLFLASGGVMLGVGAVAAYFAADDTIRSQVPRNVALTAIAAVLVLGLIASALRQGVWRDNLTLFTRTVRDAPASYRAHLGLATVLFERKQYREEFKEIQIAHRLYPNDLTVVQYLGEVYARNRNCPVAMKYFRRVLSEDPSRSGSRLGLAGCLITRGEYADARKILDQGLAIGEAKNAMLQLKAINDSVEAATRSRSR